MAYLVFLRNGLPSFCTAVSGTAVYVDGNWSITGRTDSIVYTTDLTDTITSLGFDTSGATVADIKGMTFSTFVDTYAFPVTLASIASFQSATLTEDVPAPPFCES